MTTSAIYRVEGGTQLRAGLKRVEGGLEDLKATHLKIAGVIAGRARTKAPQGPTGRTAASVRPGATQRASIVRAGRASLPYVPRDHYGDPPGGSIAPNPWLIDAAQETEPQWFAIYEHDIEVLIDRF
ncbi:HK97 gp10 family phage protein [Aeromicrobium sp. 9AM]|uniref:HK97 gp10 family phage protein n=1 Tax=Aeromicrobium sp. 9AM TaxID=2653126 RepID=UPI0012F25DEA|nr:HK97 gp10 family phage protein [Aeromicrobium sp. 9AM]VXC21274.1 conserved hypothetical protein [Aeromicrobium sp. 9AM]